MSAVKQKLAWTATPNFPFQQITAINVSLSELTNCFSGAALSQKITALLL